MPTEKSQWNNLYRSLKDKVTSDIMEIHEKYKTPTHYKNFMSTIVLTNENALRVKNDDRRTVFLDVSPSRKGDLNYFKKLGDAMKNLGASEAFYAYLRAIADAYPDFNGNPPPMTASKQDHIISTLPPLFQFIKDTYLAVKNHITDLPVQEFYRYIPHTEKPVEEKPAPIEEKPTEEQPVLKKTTPPVPPKPDSLKVKPAPVIKEDSVPEEPPAPVEEPDQEDIPPAEEPVSEADDDYDVLDDLLSDPAPEQQSESPAESSASVAKPDPELAPEEQPVVELIPEEQPIPEPDTEPEIDRDPEPKQGTKAHWAWYERHRWDRKPWVKNSKDHTFDDLYNTGKDLWAKYQDASDEYDWDILAFEVEESPTTRIEDEYQYYLREVVDRFKNWIEYNGDLQKAPSRKELADIIRAYKEDHDAEIIPTPPVVKL
ncbi:unnamed protein product [Rhizophagus irregularis]|nr:unnamed protein product [Rhizophagus irregularis]